MDFTSFYIVSFHSCHCEQAFKLSCRCGRLKSARLSRSELSTNCSVMSTNLKVT